jgi:DnaJ-domain-containing protein 1
MRQELSDDEEWCLEDEEDDEDEDKDKISDGARAAAGAGRRDGETRGDPTSSDLYKVLGVERDAGEREIKRAYRREGQYYPPHASPVVCFPTRFRASSLDE